MSFTWFQMKKSQGVKSSLTKQAAHCDWSITVQKVTFYFRYSQLNQNRSPKIIRSKSSIVVLSLIYVIYQGELDHVPEICWKLPSCFFQEFYKLMLQQLYLSWQLTKQQSNSFDFDNKCDTFLFWKLWNITIICHLS